MFVLALLTNHQPHLSELMSMFFGVPDAHGLWKSDDLSEMDHIFLYNN